MAAAIHPSAVVDPAARVGEGTRIGPFCVVGPDVELDDGVELKSHVVVTGCTRVGSGTVIYPFASVGERPQDLKYRGEASRLVIGRNVTIREHATLNTGTEGGGMETRIGDDCLIMIGAHVAHDCQLGVGVILSNHTAVAGHVVVGDHARFGGHAASHQFVRIGHHAMIGGMTAVDQDVIPYGLVVGPRGYLAGLNLVGLRRQGVDRDDIHALRNAYRILFDETGEMSQRMAEVEERYGMSASVRDLLDFVRHESGRKILKPKLPDAP